MTGAKARIVIDDNVGYCESAWEQKHRQAILKETRDATSVPSASSAPACAVTATGNGSGVRAGARPGQKVTFAGGPGDQGADLGRD